jgi:hypothetical protein
MASAEPHARGHRRHAVVVSTITMLLVATFAHARPLSVVPEEPGTPHWIDGTPILTRLFPNPITPTRLPSAPAQNVAPRFDVRHKQNFFAFDFTTSKQYIAAATLRAVGDFCYVYVEDAEWNTRVNQNAVDRTVRAFEDDTPGDPSRGIYQIEVDAFGPPPDIDDDPRVVLLLLDIRDNFKPPTGSFVAGYFTSVNQQAGNVRDPRWGVTFQSNETEMVYVDVNPLDVMTNAAMGILAHEFQHLIHFAYDPSEDTWVNEGASEFAMFLCGYSPTSHVRQFEAEPSVSLVEWPNGVGSSLPYYGSAYLWMLYLYEQYGGLNTLKRIVQSPQRGVTGVETALNVEGFSAPIRQVVGEWRAAIAADDDNLEGGRYGIQNESVRITSRPHLAYPVSQRTSSLDGWAGHFLEFRSPSGDPLPLQVDLTAEGRWRDAFTVRALLFRSGELIDVRDVSRVPLEARFMDAFEEFGVDATRILLSVAFQPSSEGENADYEYSVRLGAPVTFQVVGFRNPIQRDYIELVALPSVPVEAGTVAGSLTTQGLTLKGDMKTADGGSSFGVSFRVPDNVIPQREWTWILTHFDQVVGEGSIQLPD